MHWLYVIKSESRGTLYFGYTNDLKSRLQEHNDGKSFYTKPRGPLELVYAEVYKSKVDAINREKQLKKYAKAFGILKSRIRNCIN